MNDIEARSQDVRQQHAGPKGNAGQVTIVALLAGAVVLLYLLHTILLPFVLAAIVAYVFTPVLDWLDEKTPVPRWVYAVATLMILLGIAAIIGYLGAPALINEIIAVGGDLRGAVQSLVQKFIGNGSFKLMGQTVSAGTLADAAVSGIRDWFGQSGRVLEIAVLGFAGFFAFILTWVMTGYLLVDGHRVARGLLWLVPPSRRRRAMLVWSYLDPVLRRYFIGVALVIAYAAVAAYIGLGLFLHLRHAVVLAMMTGLLEAIPIVGPLASAVIAGLAAVQEAKGTWGIILYVIYATALRISIDEFIGPIVLGRASYLGPVVVMVAFLIGAALFGIVGMILAVPVALAIKIVLKVHYEELHRGTG